MGQEDGYMLELSTMVAAPPARTFELLTDKREISQWWGPHGFTTPEIEMELRPGGSYRFTMQPPEGEVFHLRGEFTEVSPGQRLAYTFAWEEPDADDVETFVTLTLRALDGGTEISLVQGTFTTEARLELHRGGWTDGFERLSAMT
jgi:uncharacterized protein YndB with AHSA1/START domain